MNYPPGVTPEQFVDVCGQCNRTLVATCQFCNAESCVSCGCLRSYTIGTHDVADHTSVTVDGKVLDLRLSLLLRQHSPTGFAWGYGGSGPAQTALAILLDVTEDADLALEFYQRFKVDHVMQWPWSSTHAHTSRDVRVCEWLRSVGAA